MNRRGFTLLELLVSATLIAVLTTIGIVSYSSVNRRSRDVKRKSDIEQIRSALEMFRSDMGYYPSVGDGSWTNAAGLDTGGATGLVSTYMPSIPDDPQSSSKDYYYRATNRDATTGRYYGYCVCGCLEGGVCDGTHTIANTCTSVSLIASCNYYLKSP